jgi:hypothetical protein
MSVKDLGYYKLDTNIDGFYVDVNGNVKPVEDMIGVIGATDGPAAYPEGTALNSTLSKEDILSLENRNEKVDQIKNTRGHGLIYDKEGTPIGSKGQIFLKDGKGNFTTLLSLLDNSRMIKEKRNKIRMKDQSLFDAGYRSEIGISLDELINFADLSNTSFSKGNILQVARNYTGGDTTLTIPTVSLRSNAVVWIIARASMKGEGKIKIRVGNEVLDEVFFKSSSDMSKPYYCSYVGSLPDQEGEELVGDDCSIYKWDFTTKSFTKEIKDTSETLFNHEIVLEIESEDDSLKMNNAVLNVMCMEEISRDVASVQTGFVVMSEKDGTQKDILFDEPFDLEDYSISINLEDGLQAWYSDKNVNGFTINTERVYEGRVYWTAVKK